MSIISKMRKQYAILWTRDGFSINGEPEFSSPIGIKCRWDDSRVEFVNNSGEVLISKSTVYVDRVVEEGDYLLEIAIAEAGDTTGLTEQQILDALAASLTESSPQKNDGAYPVRGFMKTPNLKATETLYTAML
jgi:hypothetical protein